MIKKNRVSLSLHDWSVHYTENAVLHIELVQ